LGDGINGSFETLRSEASSSGRFSFESVIERTPADFDACAPAVAHSSRATNLRSILDNLLANRSVYLRQVCMGLLLH
jgi:hypothetical protein